MSIRQKPARHVAVLLTGLLGLALGGCSPSEPPSPASAPATQSPAATASASPAASPSPSAPPAPTGSSGASASTGTRTAKLTLFYVAVDDPEGTSGPKIGCGDALVATETGPVTFTNQVEAALEALLEDKSETHGESGLRNALANSTLGYQSSTVSGDTVTVKLTGVPMSSGTCDDPRIIEQLKYTAKVAAGVGNARILIEGTDIEDFLSQK
ncbi:GerMN domain-containing protein [Paeniglutamicibacter sp. R2-26]|uniref:GerMN domain-containing protein n=1 Tax=Paeniglutamicibacter sp. R2-26 TaxID=3144417 RepID=UPI003EE4F592